MIRLHTYRLPFQTPFRTSGHLWTHREGLLLEWAGTGARRVAEAAPLPGRSHESLSDVIDFAVRHRKEFEQWIRSETDTPPDPDPLPPSLRFALSALRLQVRLDSDFPSRPDGTPGFEANSTRNPGLPLRMNGIIGLGSPEHLHSSIVRQLGAGYRILKVKLGENPETELATLRELSAEYPELQLRIDANRSWEREEGRYWLRELESLPVDYCEEPLANPTWDELARLQGETTTTIALDESLTHPSDLHQATTHPPLSTFILKATLLGDLQEIHHAIRSCPRPIRTIWSSTLESAVGRTTLRRAARTFGSANEAHGLDTGTLFTDDLLQEEPDNPDHGPIRPAIMCLDWAAPASRLRRNLLNEIA